MPNDERTLPHEPEAKLPTGDALPSIERYVIGTEIARGGMGAIHRATDTVLNREVAINVLQEQFPAKSPLARRFVEEAHITGLLQHPGIPPIHDLGTLPDGRPFLAMKLIRGRTLADLLHKRPDAAHERSHFLTVFEAICHAVGFAHAQGIIHRDLKPANVMVGAFGEVQVMDWGLAKSLASRAASAAGSNDDDGTEGDARSLTQHGSPDADPDRTTDQTADLSTDERTRSGQALGTPAFMPPEQARGEADRIGPRSDVFGLGAILCTILIGRPPFVATSAERARLMAAEGKLDDAFARLDTCGVDAELIALCKRCLSAEPEARPAHGGDVAALVSQYRAQVQARLQQAETEKAAAEVRTAEVRKRQRQFVVAAAAVSFVLLAGLAASIWQMNRAISAEEQSRHNEDQAKANAEESQRNATQSERNAQQARDERDAKDAALQAEKEARQRTLTALRSLTEDVVERRFAAGQGYTLTDDDRAFLKSVQKQWEAFAAVRGDDAESRAIRAEGRLRVGTLLRSLGELNEAAAAFDEAVALYGQLAADFPTRPDYHQELAKTTATGARS